MNSKKQRARFNRKTTYSVIGTILLVAGVTLALSPLLTNVYARFFLAEPVDEEIAELLENGNEAEIPYMIEPEEQEPPESPEPKEPDHPEALLEQAGVLKIPALDLMMNVGYGVELSDLQSGPGFYPESGYPDTGNVSIAGHRTTYGAPFRHVDELVEGDEIRLFYNEKVYIYRVEEVFATHTTDWSVIDPTEKPALTLTTCHPPGWASERLIVRAYLEEDRGYVQ